MGSVIVRVGIVVITLVLLTLGAGPQIAQGQPSTIKIVSSLPRTGPGKRQTDSIVNAFKMALDEVNSQVDGVSIVYEDLDDATAAKGAWDVAKEAENARRAVADPSVMVYLGTFNSGAAKVAIPILNVANIAMISPSNTYPGLTIPGAGLANEPNVFYPNGVRNYARVTPADDLEGAVGAVWAKQDGIQRVYVLDDTELYGHTIASVFARSAKQLGIDVVGGPEGIDPKAAEYGALAAKIQGTAPDLVYFGGISQNHAGQLLKDLRAVLGTGVKFMGPDGIYEQTFLNDAGAAAEGTSVTFSGIPPQKLSGKGAEWYQRYKERFSDEPDVYAPYGYEAMKLALAAIHQAGGRGRDAVRAAVLASTNVESVFGRWSLDVNGDTTLTAMSGRRVRNGVFDDDNAVTLTADQLAGAVRAAPGLPLLPLGALPPIGAPIFEDPLLAPGALQPDTCPTGLNDGGFVAEGFRLRVSGKCSDTSTNANVVTPLKGRTFDDDDVRLELRLPSNPERARFGLIVRGQPNLTDGYYVGEIIPVAGLVRIMKWAQGQATVLAARTDLDQLITRDGWTSLAIRARGPNLWLLLNDQPVLVTTDAAYGSGGVWVGLIRVGDLDDQETTAVLKNLRISGLAASGAQVGGARTALWPGSESGLPARR